MNHTQINPTEYPHYMISDSALTRFLEDYLRELVKCLPTRAPLDEPVNPYTASDNRLLKLLELASRGDVLRGLTHLQTQCLLLSVGGRAFVPCSTVVGFTRVQESGATRPLTSAEIARHLGVSHKTYRYQLTKARDRVRANVEARLAA